MLFFTEALIGNRQFGAPLLAAAGQYFPAIRRLHALTETVHGFSAADVRLVGSFFTGHNRCFFLLAICVEACRLHRNRAPSPLFVKGRRS